MKARNVYVSKFYRAKKFIIFIKSLKIDKRFHENKFGTDIKKSCVTHILLIYFIWLCIFVVNTNILYSPAHSEAIDHAKM